jgi:hypothetical protein
MHDEKLAEKDELNYNFMEPNTFLATHKIS